MLSYPINYQLNNRIMLIGDIFVLAIMFGLVCWALYLTRDDRKDNNDVKVAK